MKISYGFLTLFTMSSCAAQFYTATDFVYVGEYTQGLEGPAVDAEGNLYFVNPEHSGTIGKVDAAGNFSIFIEQLPEGSTANGIRINAEGHLLLADYTGHNVLEVDPQTKAVSVYAHEPSANQPNDITLGADGTVFASDPNWKESTGNIWRVERGAFINVAADMGTTNGIEISPDGTTLYVNESAQRKVWAFDITPNKTLANKRLLTEFQDFGMDGMRCDVKGNLYITRHGKGTVVKISPQGELLEEIQLQGTKPSNIAFGGPDGRTAYITLQDRGYIETFRVPDPGNAFTVLQRQRKN